MQSRDFVFWLQGFFELTDSRELTPEQVNLIKTHLDLVFKHDPSIPREQMKHPVQPLPDIVKDLPKWDWSDHLKYPPAVAYC